jgi:hypothetical protein
MIKEIRTAKKFRNIQIYMDDSLQTSLTIILHLLHQLGIDEE